MERGRFLANPRGLSGSGMSGQEVEGGRGGTVSHTAEVTCFGPSETPTTGVSGKARGDVRAGEPGGIASDRSTSSASSPRTHSACRAPPASPCAAFCVRGSVAKSAGSRGESRTSRRTEPSRTVAGAMRLRSVLTAMAWAEARHATYRVPSSGSCATRRIGAMQHARARHCRRQNSTAQHNTAQHTAQHSTARCAALCCAVCCAVLCCVVLCCVVLCCAVLCCAVLCCVVLCCAVLCCAVLCCVVLCLCCAVLCLCCAVLCCAVLCCAVLCCAALCCVVLCCAVQCCAVLCCAVLCSPVRSRTGARNSMRPNESHGPLRSVAVIGRISVTRVPALSQPNQGLEAPRPGPSETFRSTIRQSGGMSPGQPNATAARRPGEGRPSATGAQQLGRVHMPTPRRAPRC